MATSVEVEMAAEAAVEILVVVTAVAAVEISVVAAAAEVEEMVAVTAVEAAAVVVAEVPHVVVVDLVERADQEQPSNHINSKEFSLDILVVICFSHLTWFQERVFIMKIISNNLRSSW